jgi:hypothetical protein
VGRAACKAKKGTTEECHSDARHTTKEETVTRLDSKLAACNSLSSSLKKTTETEASLVGVIIPPVKLQSLANSSCSRPYNIVTVNVSHDATPKPFRVRIDSGRICGEALLVD